MSSHSYRSVSTQQLLLQACKAGTWLCNSSASRLLPSCARTMVHDVCKPTVKRAAGAAAQAGRHQQMQQAQELVAPAKVRKK